MNALAGAIAVRAPLACPDACRAPSGCVPARRHGHDAAAGALAHPRGAGYGGGSLRIGPT